MGRKTAARKIAAEKEIIEKTVPSHFQKMEHNHLANLDHYHNPQSHNPTIVQGY